MTINEIVEREVTKAFPVGKGWCDKPECELCELKRVARAACHAVAKVVVEECAKIAMNNNVTFGVSIAPKIRALATPPSGEL